MRTWRALGFLIKGLVILVVLFIINAATSPHYWWVQWAALGIGIAWILCLLRVIRAALLVGGLAALLAHFMKNRNAPPKSFGNLNF
jgi:hypothetical protein